jgi:hypothetical protein
LEKRTEQILPRSERDGGKGEGGMGGKMAQTMYTHMNKCISNFLKRSAQLKQEKKMWSIYTMEHYSVVKKNETCHL